MEELEKLRYRLYSRCSKAMKDYGLVKDGDKILVGLSGGMDSLTLLDLLAQRAKILKPRFSVEALHVSMDNMSYESDLDYLGEFCEQRGVKFHHRTAVFPESESKRKSPCFLCSWNRRKKLFETAAETGCNKVALGHHQDDIIKTMLMNIVFQGAFATMPPLLKMDKMPLSIIRPMCTLKERDIKEYARLSGFRKQSKSCPHERETQREKVNGIFELMQELNPQARHSLWGALSNVQEQYLPKNISTDE